MLTLVGKSSSCVFGTVTVPQLVGGVGGGSASSVVRLCNVGARVQLLIDSIHLIKPCCAGFITVQAECSHQLSYCKDKCR